MTPEVIQLAILWNFTKSECIAINQSLQMYITTKENDFMLGLDQILFWKTKSNLDSSLRHLATVIFKIKGHAAPVETLFSGMSYPKTKTCNHISVENLKMYTMMRNDLARFIPDEGKKQRKRNKSRNDNVISTLTPPVVNVDDVEEGIVHDIEKEFDEMIWDQDDKKEHGGHNNGQAFLIEKLFNLTELKKSKSDNVVAVEEWKTNDDPSEYNFLISNILNL